MLENDTQFSSKKSEKVLNTSGIIFFGTSKFHEKSWIFCIKISIVQKKVDEKTTFPKSPICHWTSIFRIFERNQFFFVHIYTLKKKMKNKWLGVAA